jgi:hypothetical protein
VAGIGLAARGRAQVPGPPARCGDARVPGPAHGQAAAVAVDRPGHHLAQGAGLGRAQAGLAAGRAGQAAQVDAAQRGLADQAVDEPVGGVATVQHLVGHALQLGAGQGGRQVTKALRVGLGDGHQLLHRPGGRDGGTLAGTHGRCLRDHAVEQLGKPLREHHALAPTAATADEVAAPRRLAVEALEQHARGGGRAPVGAPGMLLAGLRVEPEQGRRRLVAAVGGDRGEAPLQAVVDPAQRAGVAAHGHGQHAVETAAALVQQPAVAVGGQAQLEARVIGLGVGTDAFVEAPAQQAVGRQRVADGLAGLGVDRALLAGGHPFGLGDAQAAVAQARHRLAARARLGGRHRARCRAVTRQRAAGQQPGRAGQREQAGSKAEQCGRRHGASAEGGRVVGSAPCGAPRACQSHARLRGPRPHARCRQRAREDAWG